MNKEFIFKVFSAVDNRNLSTLANGIVSITKKEFQKLKSIAKKMAVSININKESNIGKKGLKKLITHSYTHLFIHSL